MESYEEDAAEADAMEEIPVQTDRLDGVRAWKLKHHDGAALTKEPLALQTLLNFLDNTGGVEYLREETENELGGSLEDILGPLLSAGG